MDRYLGDKTDMDGWLGSSSSEAGLSRVLRPMTFGDQVALDQREVVIPSGDPERAVACCVTGARRQLFKNPCQLLRGLTVASNVVSFWRQTLVARL